MFLVRLSILFSIAVRSVLITFNSKNKESRVFFSTSIILSNFVEIVNTTTFAAIITAMTKTKIKDICKIIDIFFILFDKIFEYLKKMCDICINKEANI
jgi:hypothetical protein